MKSFKLVMIFWVLSLSLKAQTLTDVFTSSSITWYGLDFSNAQFVGTADVWGEPDKLKTAYMPAWNSFVLSEPDKYNLKKSFKKDFVAIDLKKVTEINSSISVASTIVPQNDENLLEESTIVSQVAKYAEPTKKGIGAVMVVEYFDKWKIKGLVHVVFFNVANGKTLLIKTLEGDAAGFGLRNYWAKSFFNILKKCEKNWGKWKKESGVK